MKSINSLRKFLLEENLEIRIFNNKVDIVNYNKIGQIDSNQITVYHSDGFVIVKGTKLVISKLLNNEILIDGIISGIELRNYEK